MKMKCGFCGITTEYTVSGDFCSNSCRIATNKKWRRDLRNFYRELRRKYKRVY